MKNIYKSLAEFEDYIVFQDGTIKKGSKVLKGNVSKYGYRKVGLGKKNKKMFVHRIVAMSFIPNPKNLPQVNHKDGNKLNNHYLNLEWVSNYENTVHFRKSKKHSSKYVGVSWNKHAKKWIANIRDGKKQIYLGLFNSELQAFNAYKNYEKSV